MRNLSLNDGVQQELVSVAHGTERLIAGVIKRLTGKTGEAIVTLLSDAGLAHNITRMRGGFYTGTAIEHNSPEPLVFPDATMNACSASLHILSRDITSQEDFNVRVAKAVGVSRERYPRDYPYDLSNFDTGNHFVTYGHFKSGADIVPAVMLHRSASEYKKTHQGLYPVKENWYYAKIQVHEDEELGRYIRYLSGDTAEQFINIARNIISPFNEKGHHAFSELAFGDILSEHRLHTTHYGMPSSNNIAIGALWDHKQTERILLTQRGSDIVTIRSIHGAQNDIVALDGTPLLLSPHGFGKRSKNPRFSLHYTDEALIIDGTAYRNGDSLDKNTGFEIRGGYGKNQQETDKIVDGVIEQIRSIYPFDITGRFTPIYSNV